MDLRQAIESKLDAIKERRTSAKEAVELLIQERKADLPAGLVFESPAFREILSREVGLGRVAEELKAAGLSNRELALVIERSRSGKVIRVPDQKRGDYLFCCADGRFLDSLTESYLWLGQKQKEFRVKDDFEVHGKPFAKGQFVSVGQDDAPGGLYVFNRSTGLQLRLFGDEYTAEVEPNLEAIDTRDYNF